MKIRTILIATALFFATTTIMSQTPNTVAPQQEQADPDVLDKELEQFAKVYLDAQEKGKDMQENATKAIEDGGMTMERYNEIAGAQQNPNAEVDASNEEIEKMNAINGEVKKIQENYQNELEASIIKEGLTMERYQEIFQAVQQSPELQQKFGEIING